MKLAYKFRKPKTKQLDILCFISKKLYNHANWYIRQDFFQLGNWLRYGDLNFILKKMMTGDGFILGCPVYWGSLSAQFKTFLDRTHPFSGLGRPLRNKPVGGVTVALGKIAGQENVLYEIIRILECDVNPKQKYKGILCLSEYDLYDFNWTLQDNLAIEKTLHLLTGELSIFEIATKIERSFKFVYDFIMKLYEKGLITIN